METENNAVNAHVTFVAEDPSTNQEFILENLRKVEGVSFAREGIDTSRFEVEFDPTRIDPSQLTNLLKQAGISVHRVSPQE